MLCGGMCATEPAGYEWCVSETGSVTHARLPGAGAGASAGSNAGACVGAGGMRARHASDGDILAPSHRPESGAFSGESVPNSDVAQHQPWC